MLIYLDYHLNDGFFFCVFYQCCRLYLDRERDHVQGRAPKWPFQVASPTFFRQSVKLYPILFNFSFTRHSHTHKPNKDFFKALRWKVRVNNSRQWLRTTWTPLLTPLCEPCFSNGQNMNSLQVGRQVLINTLSWRTVRNSRNDVINTVVPGRDQLLRFSETTPFSHRPCLFKL